MTPTQKAFAEGLEPAPEPDRIAFSPAKVFYDGPSGKFMVDAGEYFRVCGRKSPVTTGVTRYFREQGYDEKEAKEAAREAISDAEVDRHVEWSGNLAGHRKGLMRSADFRPMLVLTSPSIPDPQTGPSPVILDLIRQAFPDAVQRDVFLGWLAGSYRAARAGKHHPAPMLCLAGAPNTGKSLLALVVKLILGGRVANPHAAWTGSMSWNDDLFGCELLLLDDCTGSTDRRARLNFAANFKEATYSAEVSLRKRNTTSMSARPVWRTMVCCNDTPESLLILPPITPDMDDKVILLKISKITPPMDTSNVEGRAALQAEIEAELPMLANRLERFEIPEPLRDSRGGITAWRHPDLSAALESTKPEHQLEELIVTGIKTAPHLWHDLPAILTSGEIEGRLIHRDSDTRDQARTLFGNWSPACGTYLGRLADGDSHLVTDAGTDAHRKVRKFKVSRPPLCG